MPPLSKEILDALTETLEFELRKHWPHGPAGWHTRDHRKVAFVARKLALALPRSNWLVERGPPAPPHSTGRFMVPPRSDD